MKKTIILSVVMAFATFGAFAQQENGAASSRGQMRSHGTPEERAKSQADRINGILQLSPDQYTKVLEVAKNFINQKDALRASGAQGEDMRAKYKELNQQEEAQLKAILTPDQFTKMQEARKAHEGHRPQ